MGIHCSGGKAAVAAILTNTVELIEEVRHQTIIFPEDTSETVTLTAAGADVWSAWTEIVDNNGVTFSSKVAAASGHISVIVVETVSVNNQLYMAEFGYGASNTVITRIRTYSGAVPKQDTRVYSLITPAGETIRYRMKCSQAGPQSLTVHIRYHFD